MATFGINEVDKYGSNGSAGFFGLKDDKDTAVIRFMYETVEDIRGISVHEVEVDNKKRYVNCLKAYNQPVEVCPFCLAGMKVHAKLFIPVYDEDAQEVKVWDRGKTFSSKISSLASRYQPLVSTPFEVERNGKKGDTNTTYETYALQTDETTLDDLPEAPVILGGLVLDKSAEAMDFYLDYGYFEDLDPDNEEKEEEAPVSRRNPQSDRRPAEPEKRQPEAPARRTPTTSKNNQSAPAGRRTPNSRDRF